MPRIAQERPAAEPSSPRQYARRRRVLQAAADIASEVGIDRVQMHEVAKEAGVAIGTLYRYFPSKTHLFVAVMADLVDDIDARVTGPEPGRDPVDAVFGLMVEEGRRMHRRPLLASAMMQSIGTAHIRTVPDADRIDETFRAVVLRLLGEDDPSPAVLADIRLLVQCWYGMLAFSLNGRTSLQDAEADMRIACRKLLGP
ncbi:TetR family transcriptional regulator [Nocardiopsis coralliicola]